MNTLNDTEQTYQPRIQNVISDKCHFKECDGSGLIAIYDDELGEMMAFCRCREHRELMNKIKSARIPLEYEQATVKAFDPNLYTDPIDIEKAKYAKQVTIRFVEKYYAMKEMGKGLYLYSQTKGVGKTHLAISVANALIQKYQVQPLYISSVNLLNEIKKTFQQSDNNTTYDLLQTFKEAEVLIIDDFGVEKATDWSEEIITQILEERMNYKRITIITSNIAINQLNKKYPTGRIESRIEKTTFPINLPEESVRKKLSKQENDLIAKLFFE